MLAIRNKCVSLHTNKLIIKLGSMKKRLFMMAVVLLMTSVAAIAQVTTAGITGVVKADGEEAIGATITAKDTRSGAVYRAVTNIDGRYTITGMRAGGPYEVEVSYIGYQTSKFTGFQLQLGQNTVVDAELSEKIILVIVRSWE